MTGYKRYRIKLNSKNGEIEVFSDEGADITDEEIHRVKKAWIAQQNIYAWLTVGEDGRVIAKGPIYVAEPRGMA